MSPRVLNISSKHKQRSCFAAIRHLHEVCGQLRASVWVTGKHNAFETERALPALDDALELACLLSN